MTNTATNKPVPPLTRGYGLFVGLLVVLVVLVAGLKKLVAFLARTGVKKLMVGYFK